MKSYSLDTMTAIFGNLVQLTISDIYVYLSNMAPPQDGQMHHYYDKGNWDFSVSWVYDTTGDLRPRKMVVSHDVGSPVDIVFDWYYVDHVRISFPMSGAIRISSFDWLLIIDDVPTPKDEVSYFREPESVLWKILANFVEVYDEYELITKFAIDSAIRLSNMVEIKDSGNTGSDRINMVESIARTAESIHNSLENMAKRMPHKKD